MSITPHLERMFSAAPERPPMFFGRDAELELLDTTLNSLGVAEVVGKGGTGKTALALLYARLRQDCYADRVIHYNAYSRAGLPAHIEREVEQLRSGPALVIIDTAELLDRSELLQSMHRIAIDNRGIHFLILSRIDFDIGTRIPLNGLAYEPFRDLLRYLAGTEIKQPELDQLWQVTGGNPQLLKTLLQAWHDDPNRPIGSLGGLFEPFTAPGILGPDGKPLRRGSEGQRIIATRVRLVANDLSRIIAARPELLFQLEPHQFEELAAELFEKMGFTAVLTPRTRDGGKDLYLARSNELGSFRYAVECKRYAPNRPVSIDVIQRLAGVVDTERLTAGIVLTTSRFSQDAIKEAAKIQYRMSLQGYTDLKAMLETFGSLPRRSS